MLSEEADIDVKANSAFWRQYEGRASEWSGKINDAYLKSMVRKTEWKVMTGW
jgi:hypothetical protein